MIPVFKPYIPNNHYEMYRNYKAQTPICEEVWEKLLTLPLFPDLTNAEVDTIVREIKKFRSRGRDI